MMDNQNDVIDGVEPSASTGRIRPLTILLWLQVIGNLLAAVLAPVMLVEIRRKSMPEFPDWVVWPFSFLCLAAAGCAYAVLNWKKWGFFGYALSAFGIVGLHVAAGLGPAESSLFFMGTVLQFVLLHLGGPRKAWSRLK